MDLQKEAQAGSRAEMLLEDLQPYFDMVEGAILDKWKTSPVGDEKGQHELRLMYKLLGDLKANIKTVIDTGKMAKIELERDNLFVRIKDKVRSVV